MFTVEPVPASACVGSGGPGAAAGSGSGIIVVRLRGSADIHSSEHLESVLAGVAAQRPAPRAVVLDLDTVDIVISLAIGVLVSFRKSIRGSGGRVVMACVGERIEETLRFTRVDELFPRYPTVEAAIAAVAEHRVRP